MSRRTWWHAAAASAVLFAACAPAGPHAPADAAHGADAATLDDACHRFCPAGTLQTRDCQCVPAPDACATTTCPAGSVLEDDCRCAPVSPPGSDACTAGCPAGTVPTPDCRCVADAGAGGFACGTTSCASSQLCVEERTLLGIAPGSPCPPGWETSPRGVSCLSPRSYRCADIPSSCGTAAPTCECAGLVACPGGALCTAVSDTRFNCLAIAP